MYDFLSKNGVAVAFGIGALIVLAYLASILMGDMSAVEAAQAKIDSSEILTNEDVDKIGVFNIAFYGAYFLLFACAIGMLIFIILSTFTNLGGAKSTLWVVAAIALFLIIGFVLVPSGDSVTVQNLMSDKGVTSGEGTLISTMISGGIYMTAFTFLLMFGSMLYSAIKG